MRLSRIRASLSLVGLFGLAVSALFVPATACKTPTEITVELASEVGYRADMVVAVQIEREGAVEAAPARVTTNAAWPAGGTLGTVVVTPSGEEESVVMRVVLATARLPSTCAAADSAGCIVVRRRLRFTSGESSRARIVLRPACLAVYCEATSSCSADGRCGSLDSDEAFGDGGAPDAPIAAGPDPYADTVLADRPRHYYRFDEPAGSTVAKDVMGRADGTIAGVQLGITGALRVSTNAGAYFDGAATVTIPKADDLRGAFSVEVWARADTGDEPYPTILERVDSVGGTLFGYRMSKPVGTSLAFQLFRGESTLLATAQAIRFAGYSHLVAVVRGTTLEAWRDGTLEGQSDTRGSSPSSVLGPLLIGKSTSGGSPFRGALDEIAIYDYPLDREAIVRHHVVGEQKP